MLLILFVTVALGARVELEASHHHQPAAYWRAEPQDAVSFAATPLTLTFAIKLRNTDVLTREFEERSNPDSPLWREWLSLEQINAQFGADPKAVGAVASHLRQQGFHVETLGSYVRATGSVELAESYLQTKFTTYRAAHWPTLLIRAEPGVSYSVPAEIAQHVEFVAGVKGQMPSPGYKASFRPAPAAGFGVTPRIVQTALGTRGMVGKAVNNSQGFLQMIGQYFSQGDVDEAFLLYGQGKAPQYKIVGQNTPPVGIESALDSMYLATSGRGIASWCWSIDAGSQTPFIDWIAQMSSTKAVAWTWSISYGEPEQGNSASYLNRLNNDFQSLGLRGLSVSVASGDSGVAAAPGSCTKTSFAPDFPGACPSITTVGGTELTLFDTGAQKLWVEAGAGFSNFYPTPSYQKAALANYLATNKKLPAQSFWNATGRSYPDTVSLANGFWIIYNKVPTPGVAGTSCASPTFMGSMGFLNDYLMSNGKSSMGFLNPLIYKLANTGGAFTDIDDGRCNEGCDGQRGFCTQKGWDSATGWGAPFVSSIITAVKSIVEKRQ